MAIKVVDTNVWVMIDYVNHAKDAEKICAEVCFAWGNEFHRSQNQLAVDETWEILGEYRKNIARGGLAEQYLNALHSTGRIVLRPIEFDDDHIAIVPDLLREFDPSDKKFLILPDCVGLPR